MNRFVPSSTYSPSSRRATVRIAAESEPEPASVSAYAPSTSPEASLGNHDPRCSSEPPSLSPSDPSSCTARISPLVAQTFETSSIAIRASSVPVPVPPASSSKKSPKMPWSRNSSTTSHGNSCDASISAARGAIRSRASVRTRSRSSRCSSVSTSQGTRRSVWPLRGADDLGGHELAHLDDLVGGNVRATGGLYDRVRRRRLVEAVGAQPVGRDEREEPADALVRVDVVDPADDVLGELQPLGEGALDHVERHDSIVLRPLGRDEAPPERVGGGLGAVRRAGLAEDGADVVRGGVLADVEHTPDLAVRAAPGELGEDLDLACAEAVRMVRRGGEVGAELRRAHREGRKPD